MLGVVVAGALTASAQPLRALHVDTLAMHVDRARVRVGEVFHLTIHVHVRERIDALDELVVPDVGAMQNEGDERHVTQIASGTDVVETLTLESTAPGTFTFQGGYLDAVDARTGKPSRFRANTVRVVVEPRGPQRSDAALGTNVALAIVAGAALVAGAAMLLARRRRERPRSPDIPAAAASPAQPRAPRDDVAAALQAYRAAPDGPATMRLRTALFAAAGAAPGATLRDALGGTADRDLRAALLAAERTAFGPTPLRAASSPALVAAVQVWLG